MPAMRPTANADVCIQSGCFEPATEPLGTAALPVRFEPVDDGPSIDGGELAVEFGACADHAPLLRRTFEDNLPGGLSLCWSAKPLLERRDGQ